MFDWKRIQDDKERRRSAAASRSFSEKLVTLERLRDRQQQFKQLGRKSRDEQKGASNIKATVIPVDAAESYGTIKLFVMGADASFLISIASPNNSSVARSVWGENSGPITGTRLKS